jgi:hypothetical protein
MIGKARRQSSARGATPWRRPRGVPATRTSAPPIPIGPVRQASPSGMHVITGVGRGGAEKILSDIIARRPEGSGHSVLSLTVGEPLFDFGPRFASLGLRRGEISPRGLWRLRSATAARAAGSAATAPPRPRLRAPLPDRRSLRPNGHDLHHATTAGRKALSINPNFPDGLSSRLRRIAQLFSVR